jgi:serine/threonine-protein kinase RsbW
MEISTNPENISIIRLTASGIANKIGFSIDDIEDIKVAISEACTNVIKHTKVDNFSIVFEIYDEKFIIIISDDGIGCTKESIPKVDLCNPKVGGLGIYIIKTLMDDVEIKSVKEKGTVIKMIKFLGVDN